MIGVDFDNTIVNYDRLFHKIALERNLIPADSPPSKQAVRDHLRDTGREPVWTELQGYVYGMRMSEAEPFPGVLDFFRQCRQTNQPVCIISHKTRTPYLGPPYDLHRAAREWLEQQHFFDDDGGGLTSDNVFLELTRAEKIQRIITKKCTVFIDDLPELLVAQDFPKNITRIWFAPADKNSPPTGCHKADNWHTCRKIIDR